jgi:hypothetical protein
MAFAESVEEAGRDGLEGPLRRRGIEWTDVDEVNLSRSEGLGAAKDLRDIETGLEMIEDDDEWEGAGTGKKVSPSLIGIPLKRMGV